MHRDLKLQHALLQQVAAKVGVKEQATEQMRKLVEEAPEGAPIAALMRTPPLSQEKPDPLLTLSVATVDDNEESGSSFGSKTEKGTGKADV